MAKAKKTPRKEKVGFIPSLGDRGQGEEVEERPLLSRLAPLLLPLIVALVVSYFIVSITAVPKGTYNNAVIGLTKEVRAVEASIEEVKAKQTALSTSIKNLEENPTAYKADINKLTGDINDIRTQLVNLVNQDSSTASDLAKHKARIDEYEVVLTDMEDILVELQLITEDKEVVEPEETTRWDLDVYAVNYPGNVTLGYMVSPSRIEDEDDYDITLTVLNNTTSTIPDLRLEVALRPRGDVKVDENKIYLDTVRYPYSLWDTEIIEKSDGTCRRIIFDCPGITAKGGTGEGEDFEHGTTVLRLELTLAYK